MRGMILASHTLMLPQDTARLEDRNLERPRFHGRMRVAAIMSEPRLIATPSRLHPSQCTSDQSYESNTAILETLLNADEARIRRIIDFCPRQCA
jgi:hypothetical protein